MSGPFKMKGSSGLGYGNQHSKGKAPGKMYDSPAQKALVGDQNNLPEDLKAKIDAAPGKMMGAIAGIAGKLMGKKDEEASGAKYATPAKVGEAKKSERAAADGASKETVEKLKNIEAGEKKKSELTDPVKIKRVNAKLNELQPNKKT